MSNATTKRYILFQGENYYPVGGANDFTKSSDNLQELIDIAKKTTKCDDGEWCHIFDTLISEIIYEGGV